MKSLPSDTLTGDVQAFAADNRLAQPPKGFNLGSAKEKRLWDSIVACRPANAWVDVELLLIHKIVKMQTKIEEQQEKIENEGELIETNTGVLKVNPRINVVMSLNKQMLDFLSRIHVLHSPASGSALKNKSNRGRAAASIVDKARATGLLATPDDDDSDT